MDKKSIKRTPVFSNNEYVQAVSILNEKGSITYIPVNKSGTTSQIRAKAIAGINYIRWDTPGSGHDFEDSIQLSNNGSATGTTGLSGGSLPIYGGVSLSMERFDSIIQIDERNLQATVEPGVINQIFKDAVKRTRNQIVEDK